MAAYAPWITLLLGFLLGLLIYHITTIGKRQDQAAYVAGLENDLRTAQTDLAACLEQEAFLKSEHKDQVKILRDEAKVRVAELKALTTETEARAAELAACLAATKAIQQELESLRHNAAVPGAAAQSKTMTQGADDPAGVVAQTRSRLPELQGSTSRSCPQDLTQVRGIGTVYEQRLFEAGIGTFWELAMLAPEELSAVLGVANDQDADLAAIKQDALRQAEETETVGYNWDGSKPDDFEILEQIGPVFESRLYAAGICTFAALAAATVAQLEEICQAPSSQRVEYGRWIARAQELLTSGA